MIVCELTWCRNNSEVKKLHPNSNGGICQCGKLWIRDKGNGPVCCCYDEIKDCFGSVGKDAIIQEVCKKCEDLTACQINYLEKVSEQQRMIDATDIIKQDTGVDLFQFKCAEIRTPDAISNSKTITESK